MSEELEPTVDDAEGADKSAGKPKRDSRARFVTPDVEVEVEAEPEVEVVSMSEADPVVEAEPEVEVVAVDIVTEVAPVKAVDPDEVSVSVAALVYRPIRRNSGSVAVMQGRLSDLGYAAARGDLKGWYHDNTRKAVSEWQRDNKRDVTGAVSADDARVMFLGTKVVVKP